MTYYSHFFFGLSSRVDYEQVEDRLRFDLFLWSQCEAASVFREGMEECQWECGGQGGYANRPGNRINGSLDVAVRS